ncbi:hypothetical protein ASG40_07740 [Methylobacterium sp. Leaf399]|nr:hypothetical protein ASG40_07740 [Methylobacterium sp. Leaf399]
MGLPFVIITRFATPLVTRVLLLLMPAVVLAKAATLAGLTRIEKTELTDFETFHIVGRMIWQGRAAEAYHAGTMREVQRVVSGSDTFMPWTYPPPFDLVVAGVALLPVSLAYLLFTGATLAAFLLVLKRIAGEAFPAVLLAIFPAIVVTIGCGQNGFLSGTLIGLAALAFAGGRALAGLPLGLMVVKPHLAVAFALHAVAARHWRCVGLAACVVALACAAATLALGIAVWPAFVSAVAEAKAFLVAGYYPLHRMISVYAALRSLAVPAGVALAVQAGVAFLALSVVVATIRGRRDTATVLGATALAGLFVSPYAYDYDLTLYGIALAFLMPDLIRRASPREQIALLGLSLFTCGYGLLASVWHDRRVGQDIPYPGTAAWPPSLAGFALLAIVVLVWRILSRAAGPVAAPARLGDGLPLAGGLR